MIFLNLKSSATVVILSFLSVACRQDENSTQNLSSEGSQTFPALVARQKTFLKSSTGQSDLMTDVTGQTEEISKKPGVASATAAFKCEIPEGAILSTSSIAQASDSQHLKVFVTGLKQISAGETPADIVCPIKEGYVFAKHVREALPSEAGTVSTEKADSCASEVKKRKPMFSGTPSYIEVTGATDSFVTMNPADANPGNAVLWRQVPGKGCETELLIAKSELMQGDESKCPSSKFGKEVDGCADLEFWEIRYDWESSKPRTFSIKVKTLWHKSGYYEFHSASWQDLPAANNNMLK